MGSRLYASLFWGTETAMKSAIVWVLENMSLVTLLLALVLGSLAAKRKGPSSGGGWEPTVFWLLLLFV